MHRKRMALNRFNYSRMIENKELAVEKQEHSRSYLGYTVDGPNSTSELQKK